MTNTALYLAKRKKNDEFYTRYEDVETELLFIKTSSGIKLFIVIVIIQIVVPLLNSS